MKDKLLAQNVRYELSAEYKSDMNINQSREVEFYGDVWEVTCSETMGTKYEVHRVSVMIDNHRMNDFFDDAFVEEMKNEILNEYGLG